MDGNGPHLAGDVAVGKGVGSAVAFEARELGLAKFTPSFEVL